MRERFSLGDEPREKEGCEATFGFVVWAGSALCLCRPIARPFRPGNSVGGGGVERFRIPKSATGCAGFSGLEFFGAESFMPPRKMSRLIIICGPIVSILAGGVADISGARSRPKCLQVKEKHE